MRNLIPFAAAAALIAAPALAEDELIAGGELLGTEYGDIACYLVLDTGRGAEDPDYVLAAFDLCETDLVGKTVAISYTEGEVYAASCEGDPECTDTESVMIASELVAAGD